MARPVHVELSPVVINDTWPGLSNCRFTSDGDAFSSNLTSIRMHFRDSDNNVVRQLSSPSSGITIDSAANWQFTVSPITTLTFNADTYFWSIEATASNGTIKTYVTGTLEVLADATI